MAKTIYVDGNFDVCPAPRIGPIVKKYSNFEEDFQVCEHWAGKGKIFYDKSLPLVIFHTEGDEKHIDIDWFSQFGTVLHCNAKMNKGKFFNYWAYDYLNRINDYKIKLNQNNTFAKKFLCLNGRPDWHRYYTLQKLVDKNLYNKGLISFLNRYNQITNKAHYDNFKQRYNGEHTFIKKLIKHKKTIELDRSNKAIHNDDRSHDPYIYEQTSISLVTETYPDAARGLFITEKSYKPIANCHFQIWIAQPGMVEFFRNMGFDMFDDIIDNSYDEIISDTLRFNKAIQSLDLFLKKLPYLNTEQLQKRLKDNQIKYLNLKLSEEEIYSWL